MGDMMGGGMGGTGEFRVPNLRGMAGGYLRQQELGARAQGFGGTGVDRRAEGFGNAATGKYVNSPTLMMVGEGGAGEVVIPTERIKKGLPINAGVANELASIGVPGFGVGGFLKSVGKGIGGVGKGIAKGVSKAGKFLFSNMMGGAGPAAAGGGAVGGSGGGFGGVKAIEKEAATDPASKFRKLQPNFVISKSFVNLFKIIDFFFQILFNIDFYGFFNDKLIQRYQSLKINNKNHQKITLNFKFQILN